MSESNYSWFGLYLANTVSFSTFWSLDPCLAGKPFADKGATNRTAAHTRGARVGGDPRPGLVQGRASALLLQLPPPLATQRRWNLSHVSLQNFEVLICVSGRVQTTKGGDADRSHGLEPEN